MMYRNLSQSGFSLVETLVAITILLVIIVGPMTLVTTSARSTNYASEQVVAFFLAQEGAELAQKARDDLVLRRFLPTSNSSYLADPWSTFSNQNGSFGTCFASTGCGLSVDSDAAGTISARSCLGSGCRVHLYQPTSGGSNEGQGASSGRTRYSYTPSSQTIATPYTRTITFTNVNSDQIRVVSAVTWFTGSINTAQRVEVESYLFDIYGN